MKLLVKVMKIVVFGVTLFFVSTAYHLSRNKQGQPHLGLDQVQADDPGKGTCEEQHCTGSGSGSGAEDSSSSSDSDSSGGSCEF